MIFARGYIYLNDLNVQVGYCYVAIFYFCDTVPEELVGFDVGCERQSPVETGPRCLQPWGVPHTLTEVSAPPPDRLNIS